MYTGDGSAQDADKWKKGSNNLGDLRALIDKQSALNNVLNDIDCLVTLSSRDFYITKSHKNELLFNA